MKRAHFDSNDEARAYLNASGLNVPSLHVDVWIYTLSNNPSLSVQDVMRMCSVSKDFQRLCDSGRVWDAIFRRQFGVQAFQAVQREFPTQPLLRLLAFRIQRNHSDWTLSKRSWPSNSLVQVRYNGMRQQFEVVSDAWDTNIDPLAKHIHGVIARIVPSNMRTKSRRGMTLVVRAENVTPFIERAVLVALLKEHFVPPDEAWVGCSVCNVQAALYKTKPDDGQVYCGDACLRAFYLVTPNV